MDAGAHIGRFARHISNAMGCSVHAIEPRIEFHSVLRRVPHVRLHAFCLAPESGVVELYIPVDGDATLIKPEAVEYQTIHLRGVRLDEFLITMDIAEVDLLKMDVEGAELPILETASAATLRRVRQLTVEFHDWKYPATAGRVEAIKRRMEQCEFYCIRFSRNNGDVLFVRRDLVSNRDYSYVRYCVRNVIGVKRVLRRWLREREW